MLQEKKNSKVTYWKLECAYSFLGFFHMDHSIFFLESSKTLTIHLFMFKFKKWFYLFSIHFLFSGFTHLYHSLFFFFENIFLLYCQGFGRKWKLINVFNLPNQLPGQQIWFAWTSLYCYYLCCCCCCCYFQLLFVWTFYHRVWHILNPKS